MIRILSQKAAAGQKTIRVVPMADDFSKMLAEWQILGKPGDKGGIFVITDEPCLFQEGQSVPEEVLNALTGGATLVRVRGADYNYYGDEISHQELIKVVPENQMEHSFEAMCWSETAEVYKEGIVFRSGISPTLFEEIKEEAEKWE